MADQIPTPASSPQPPQRDLPGWVFAVVILACLAGGVGFVWWFFSSSPPDQVQVVPLKPDESGTARRPPRQQRRPAQVEPLPAGALPAPPLITGSWEQTPVNNVLRDLSRQAGVRIRLDNDNAANRNITLRVDGKPFWEVLQQVNELAGLEISSQSAQSEIRLVRDTNPEAAPPVTIQGPMLIYASDVNHTTSVRLHDNSISHNLAVTITAAMLPSEHLLGVVRAPVIEQATDQRGRDLKPDANYYPQLVDVRSRPVTSFGISLNYREGAERVETLKGYFAAITADRIQAVEIDNPLSASPSRHRVDDITVSFERLSEDNGIYVLRLEIDGVENTNDPRFAFRFGGEAQSVQLLDERGRAFNRVSSSWGGHRDGFVPLTLRYRRAQGSEGPPAKLVLNLAEGLKEVRMPFQFTVPIPN